MSKINVNKRNIKVEEFVNNFNEVVNELKKSEYYIENEKSNKIPIRPVIMKNINSIELIYDKIDNLTGKIKYYEQSISNIEYKLNELKNDLTELRNSIENHLYNFLKFKDIKTFIKFKYADFPTIVKIYLNVINYPELKWEVSHDIKNDKYVIIYTNRLTDKSSTRHYDTQDRVVTYLYKLFRSIHNIYFQHLILKLSKYIFTDNPFDFKITDIVNSLPNNVRLVKYFKKQLNLNLKTKIKETKVKFLMLFYLMAAIREKDKKGGKNNDR